MRIALVVVLLIIVSSIVPTRQPVLKNYEVWWRDGLWNALWCSVSVQEGEKFVTGLKLEDFVVKEIAYDDKGKILAEKSVVFNRPYYQFDGPGFWEKSVNADKLDIVFFIDGTGSMEKHMANIKNQLHKFIDRMIQTGTDFRIFIGLYETEDEPTWPDGERATLWGPLMVEKIRKQIDKIESWGEWWNFSWGYDVVLWSVGLNWREDSRKIVVIITDVFTDSVYGPNWYFSSGCTGSMWAVDLALKEKNIRLYYCQPNEEHMAKVELSECYSPKVNIKVKQNNFDALERQNNLVKKLSWPFDQSEIELEDSPVIDSQYFFAWISDWGKEKFVSKVDVEISLRSGGKPTKFTFYPLLDPEGRRLDARSRGQRFTIIDESGTIMTSKANVSIDFYKVMGQFDLFALITGMGDKRDENGYVVVDNVRPGKYYAVLYTPGKPSYAYHQLGYTGSCWVEIGLDRVNPERIVAQVLAKDTEIYRTLGLISEIEKLDISNERLKLLASQAKTWLEKLRKDGVTLLELEALKRFNVSLGAMINCSGYVDVVQRRAKEDFLFVVDKAVQMVRETVHVTNSILDVKRVIAEIVNTFIDVITMNWSGVAAKVTIEQLVDRFVSYVTNELVDDILATVETKLFEVIENPEKMVNYFENYVKNWIKEQLSSEQINEEVENFVRQALIYEEFTNFFEKEFQKLLSMSNNFVQKNQGKHWSIDVRSNAMKSDFYKMRDELMNLLFDTSYKALKDQDTIDDWKSTLVVFEETVPLIIEFLKLFEARYPELHEVKVALEKLSSVLDSIGTLTKTYELALKVNHLSVLRTRMVSIVDRIYH
ncbi:vWA domain-containing protein [Pseudothermotoga sp.]|uniref:vWA domain-containing protein n=1 Tax=Pseudothermotoga sp. TaxID=2033661 RepID=UPI0031F71277